MSIENSGLGCVYSRLYAEELRKSDQRKLAILDAALEILVRDGLESVNYERVGKVAGMLRAHVQYYFASKEALLVDLFKLVTEAGQLVTVEKIQAAGEEPLARIEAVLEGAFAWADRRPNDVRAQLHLMNLATHDPAFRALHETIRRAGADRLEALIRASALPLRKGVTPREVAYSVQAAIIGTIWMGFSLDEAPPLHRLKELARAQVLSNFEISRPGESKRRLGKSGSPRPASYKRSTKKRRS